jgi:hypothetical protein
MVGLAVLFNYFILLFVVCYILLWLYRLKGIIIICCCFLFYLLIHFFIIFVFSKREFIKPFDDVKIQRKTITFTKDKYRCIIFINKMINAGIIRMFIYIYNYFFLKKVVWIKKRKTKWLNIWILFQYFFLYNLQNNETYIFYYEVE